MPIVVSIEGNIGSGKSTLLRNLQLHMGSGSDVIFLQEPLEDWDKVKDTNGETLLQKYCQDQNNYAFLFQVMVHLTRAAVLKKAQSEHPNSQLILNERFSRL